jgi:hypothetical protein
MITEPKPTRHVPVRVPRTITVEKTKAYRLVFDGETLRKRLKLPNDSALVHGGKEFDQPFDKLIVTYTRTS